MTNDRVDTAPPRRATAPAGMDPSVLAPVDAYKLLVGAVQPRPIAWVATTSADGIGNLAPFSFFTVASREPATLVVSVGRRPDGGPKDTLVNALASGELVVNIPSQRHRAAVAATGEDWAPEVDEHAALGLPTLPGVRVAVPRLADASMALECRLRTTVEVGSDVLLLAEVVYLHAAPGLVDEAHRVDTAALDPLGRLAGPWFSGPVSALPQSPAGGTP